MRPEPTENAAAARPRDRNAQTGTSPAADARSYWVGLTAAIVILCVLALPLFQGRVYKHDDLSRYHLPLRFFYAESLAKNDSFIWIPNIFCGFYLHGEGQVGMFHPLHLILYSSLPLDVAFNLELLISYPFMLAGMFLFLRRWRLPRDAAMFGALVFTFSGSNLLHYMHMNAVAVAAHIPWLLTAIDASVRAADPRRRALANLGVTVLTASQLLLGHPTAFWLSAVAEFLYVLLLIPVRRDWRPFLALGVAKFFGILAGCIQLIPHWDAAVHSTRSTPSLDSLQWPSVHPVHLIQLVAPYFFNNIAYEGIPYELKIYAGAMPTVLLVVLAIRRRQLGDLRRLMLGFLFLAAISVILALGEYGYLYRLQTMLPLVGLLRTPCRYILLFHLAIAVMAAIALAVASGPRQDSDKLAWRTFWPLAVPPALGILPLAIPLWMEIPPDSPMAQFLLWGIASKNHVFMGPPLFILAGVLVAMVVRGTRYARAGIMLFAAMDLGVYGLSYIWQYDPGAEVDAFKDFAPTPPEASKYRVQSDNNVWIVKGVRITDGFASIPPRHQLDAVTEARQRLAGVRWVWNKRMQMQYSTQGRVSGWEITGALPRARFVTKVLTSSNPRENVDAIDLESVALVSEKVQLPPGKPGEVVIMNDRPGRIRVATEAASPQLLVVSERYHEGWQALVDGERRPVLRVYGDFMGCLVNAGRHEVELAFRPVSLRLGAILSAVGVAFTVISFLFTARQTA